MDRLQTEKHEPLLQDGEKGDPYKPDGVLEKPTNLYYLPGCGKNKSMGGLLGRERVEKSQYL